MNIKELSLKSLLGEDWTFESDFCYADVSGSAELCRNGDSMILFRKEGEKDVSAVRFHAIFNYDKKLFVIANKLMTDIGIEIKIGDRLNKMIKKFGTPTFVCYLEEDYERYYWRYPNDNFFDYNDIFYVVHYHYLLSPDLLVCFGAPKNDNRLTDLEIVNDQKMVLEIMEARRTIKKYDNTMYQPKECLRFLKQRIENRKITGIKSKNIRFIKMEIDHCSVEGIRTEDIRLRDCLFCNVIFENYFETGFAQIKKCVFINCVFHDVFGDSTIELCDNVFQNCLFERVGMRKEDGILNANRNQFFYCTFKEISWNGEGVFFWSKINKGKMEHIFYRTNEISRSEFSDIQMEHVEVEMGEEDSVGLFDNQFNSVMFCNVTVKGPVEDTHFANCDTSGLRILAQQHKEEVLL